MSTISISKAKVQKEKGVVVLPVEEYRRLLAASVPTYYLTGKAATRLDALVEKSLREYREGKTVSAGSMAEALKKYRAHAR